MYWTKYRIMLKVLSYLEPYIFFTWRECADLSFVKKLKKLLDDT